MTKDSFIQLALEWNQGSPHEDNIIHGITWNGERNIRFGRDRLWLDIEEYEAKNVIAIRYEKIDTDGIVWDTDYVMNFDTRKMAIRLDRSFTEDSLSVKKNYFTPYFISMLIDKGYIVDDNNLPVLRMPTLVDENNLDTVASAINGTAHFSLPVVYVSKTNTDIDPVNVVRLARRLKGVAHVLVQQSNSTNDTLKDLCDSKNDYNGAVGIYYTSQPMNNKRYLYHAASGEDNMLFNKVVRHVIQTNNSQHIDTLYTWQGVTNALLRDNLAIQEAERAKVENERRRTLYELVELKESIDERERAFHKKAEDEAKAEADKILDAFENDMQRMQKQIEQLTRENERLQFENLGLRAKLDTVDDLPLLHSGDEIEFYSGEIKDLVLSILSKSLDSLADKPRRRDIVSDLIESNDYQKVSDAKAEKINRLMKDYTGLTTPIKQSLESEGFQISDDGKHYKVSYFGDGRYLVTLSKTPSDFRVGKKIVAEIVKTAF